MIQKPANDSVPVRIDPAIKSEAAAVLAEMGLTFSDACRMVLTWIAREKRLPFATEIDRRAYPLAPESLKS